MNRPTDLINTVARKKSFYFASAPFIVTTLIDVETIYVPKLQHRNQLWPAVSL